MGLQDHRLTRIQILRPERKYPDAKIIQPPDQPQKGSGTVAFCLRSVFRYPLTQSPHPLNPPQLPVCFAASLPR